MTKQHAGGGCSGSVGVSIVCTHRSVCVRLSLSCVASVCGVCYNGWERLTDGPHR